MEVSTILVVIVALLFLIWTQLRDIGKRLKERFPTEKEQDYLWSQQDPAGHWEAHKNDKT